MALIIMNTQHKKFTVVGIRAMRADENRGLSFLRPSQQNREVEVFLKDESIGTAGFTLGMPQLVLRINGLDCPVLAVGSAFEGKALMLTAFVKNDLFLSGWLSLILRLMVSPPLNKSML